MLGCSSVAAVEEVAGGGVCRYYWIACGIAGWVGRGGGGRCVTRVQDLEVRLTGRSVLQAAHKSLKRCVARGAARVAS